MKNKSKKKFSWKKFSDEMQEQNKKARQSLSLWTRIWSYTLLYSFFFGILGFCAWGSFNLAYGSPDTPWQVHIISNIHGLAFSSGILAFYYVMFGLDEIKWMFINAGIGIFGIYSELTIILKKLDKNIADYSLFAHAMPFTYYVMITFLIYRTVISFSGAEDNPARKKIVEIAYIGISLAIYLFIFNLGVEG